MLSQALMAKMYNGYIMSNTVTRDHHNLRRNLNLNGNYISNDGGDEGISIDDDGDVTIGTTGSTTTLNSFHEFTYSEYILKKASDTDDYFKISMTPGGTILFDTVDDSGLNAGDLTFQPQGDIQLNPGATNNVTISADTKTASGLFDATLRCKETLNLDTGAGGSDVHYGLWYTQTQTDLTGWDNVYLMYIDGGTNKVFSVDNNAELSCPSLTINNITEDAEPVLIDYDFTNTSGGGQTGLRVDVDRTGDVSSGFDTTIGQYTTVNTTGASGGTITSYGHRIAVVGDSGGTSKTYGITIAASGADENYALVTTGGNVGIGESAPQDTLEVNGTVLVKDALKFTQDDGNEFIDSQNDGYLDIGATTGIRLEAPTLCEDKLYFTQTDGNEYIDSLNDEYLDIDATTAIRLKADTLIEGTKKLYFNDAGGEYISGDGTNLTIASTGHVEFDGCGVGFDKISYTDATNVTVDFTTGNKAELDMAGGSIDDTLSLKFPDTSGNFLLVVKQDGSTRTIAAFATLDSAGNAGDNDGGTGGAVRWAGGSAPDLTDGSNKDDILTFYWDAGLEVCYGVATLNF